MTSVLVSRLAATLFACSLASALAAPLAAQTVPAPPAPVATAPAAGGAMAACRGDLATLCAGVATGSGRKIACLKENQSKLTPGCMGAIQAIVDKQAVRKGQAASPEAKAAAGQVRDACKADAATFCAGIEKGDGRLAKCMKDNAAKLSTACKGAIADRRAIKRAAVPTAPAAAPATTPSPPAPSKAQ
jgi:hypothetical protein